MLCPVVEMHSQCVCVARHRQCITCQSCTSALLKKWSLTQRYSRMYYHTCQRQPIEQGDPLLYFIRISPFRAALGSRCTGSCIGTRIGIGSCTGSSLVGSSLACKATTRSQASQGLGCAGVWGTHSTNRGLGEQGAGGATIIACCCPSTQL
jgi:hypothetical protein